MTILNNIIPNSFHKITTNKFFNFLSPMQKKVTLVTAAVFCGLAIVFSFRCLQRKLKLVQLNKKKKINGNQRKNIHSLNSVANQQSSNNVANKHSSNSVANQHSIDLDKNISNSTDKKLLCYRLHKNRVFALLQQNSEKKKNFSLTSIEDPKEDPFKHPILSQKKNINGIEVGVASCIGNRPRNEDTHLIDEISFVSENDLIQGQLFGVFDGHGGQEASIFVKDYLTIYLEKALARYNIKEITNDGIWKALKECFINLNAEYHKKASIDGSTATIALILNGTIWIANVGDSRTVLIDNTGTVVQATEDAKPNIPRYKRKIEKLGGTVDEMTIPSIGSVFRVNKRLAIARAIGDCDLKGTSGQWCLSAHPKITRYSLDDFKDGHIVLACDGLYDVASTDEVGRCVDDNKNVDPENLAKRLVYSAIDNKSGDNVTAMVIKL